MAAAVRAAAMAGVAPAATAAAVVEAEVGVVDASLSPQRLRFLGSAGAVVAEVLVAAAGSALSVSPQREWRFLLAAAAPSAGDVEIGAEGAEASSGCCGCAMTALPLSVTVDSALVAVADDARGEPCPLVAV